MLITFEEFQKQLTMARKSREINRITMLLEYPAAYFEVLKIYGSFLNYSVAFKSTYPKSKITFTEKPTRKDYDKEDFIQLQTVFKYIRDHRNDTEAFKMKNLAVYTKYNIEYPNLYSFIINNYKNTKNWLKAFELEHISESNRASGIRNSAIGKRARSQEVIEELKTDKFHKINGVLYVEPLQTNEYRTAMKNYLNDKTNIVPVKVSKRLIDLAKQMEFYGATSFIDFETRIKDEIRIDKSVRPALYAKFSTEKTIEKFAEFFNFTFI